MKKLIILLIVLFATSVWGAPFLVSDPNPSAVGGGYEVIEGGTVVIDAVTEANGSLRMDLAEESLVSVGNHSYSVRTYKDNGVWGKAYSTPVPFDFARPSSVINDIEGLKLVP